MILQHFLMIMSFLEHEKVSLKLLQRSFDAAAVGRVLNGDAAVSIETQDAMCSGLEAGGASKSGALSLADFERFHQVGEKEVFPLSVQFWKCTLLFTLFLPYRHTYVVRILSVMLYVVGRPNRARRAGDVFLIMLFSIFSFRNRERHSRKL